MKKITISQELETQILGTQPQLAVKAGATIFLVQEIKVGKNRIYIEMRDKSHSRTLTLRTLIKKGMEFISPKGEIFTPKCFDKNMFILQDGKKMTTGYTPEEQREKHNTYV